MHVYMKCVQNIIFVRVTEVPKIELFLSLKRLGVVMLPLSSVSIMVRSIGSNTANLNDIHVLSIMGTAHGQALADNYNYFTHVTKFLRPSAEM